MKTSNKGWALKQTNKSAANLAIKAKLQASVAFHEDRMVSCTMCGGSGEFFEDRCNCCNGDGEIPESVFNNKFN